MSKKPKRRKKIVEPESMVGEQIPEPAITELEPIVAETTTPEPIVDEPETKEVCLDDRLLDYINGLEGRFNIHKAAVTLNVEDADLIHQAWDRLYDKHLVPYMNIR